MCPDHKPTPGSEASTEGPSDNEHSPFSQGSASIASFHSGDEVMVIGLQSACHLNGSRGTIVQYVQATSRYEVRIQGHQGTKALKVANLAHAL